jgi:hypothetical protein
MCEAITRRGLLRLMGLAALGLAAPSWVSQSVQAQPAVVVPPPTGTERRVDRRIARTERRQGRRIRRAERRRMRREGRMERRMIRREARAIRRDVRQGM